MPPRRRRRSRTHSHGQSNPIAHTPRQLPALHHLPPPPDFKPLTPAFDLSTLKRQVAALQEEVAARHRQQEELYLQNARLWEVLRAACDSTEWQATQAEMERLNQVGAHACVHG